ASPESSVIRTYVELIVSLPWNVSAGGEGDVKKSRGILDADHYDLAKVKQRIVEHLAVRPLKDPRGSADRGRERSVRCVGPRGGAARSSRPRAEQGLSRQLPGRSLRPVEGHVHHDREQPGDDPARAARPHGSSAPLRLHRRGESPDRGALPDPQAGAGAWLT